MIPEATGVDLEGSSPKHTRRAVIAGGLAFAADRLLNTPIAVAEGNSSTQYITKAVKEGSSDVDTFKITYLPKPFDISLQHLWENFDFEEDDHQTKRVIISREGTHSQAEITFIPDTPLKQALQNGLETSKDAWSTRQKPKDYADPDPTNHNDQGYASMIEYFDIIPGSTRDEDIQTHTFLVDGGKDTWKVMLKQPVKDLNDPASLLCQETYKDDDYFTTVMIWTFKA